MARYRRGIGGLLSDLTEDFGDMVDDVFGDQCWDDPCSRRRRPGCRCWDTPPAAEYAREEIAALREEVKILARAVNAFSPTREDDAAPARPTRTR
ncbi:hypothetical protein [Streptomyces luteireticuli]|uniref:hypothetical protein n=1 Tax=Streptomyces luteireticuli TaxID=173858 RepID=UPI003558C8F9